VPQRLAVATANIDQPGYRSFRVALPDGRAYWTVVDDDYLKVVVADQFLFELRFGRDRAESTTRVYAGELAQFLGWCRRSGRSMEDGARHLSRFVLFMRATPTTRRGAGQGRPPGPERINHVLAVVREFFKHAVATGAVGADALTALYEVGDDRFLPAELRPEGGGLRYRARPRHRVRAPRSASPEAASQQEWEALLETATSWRDRFLLVLLWFGGLRIGEALGLRRCDLHFTASSSGVGCGVAGPHLHVVRRDNLNRAWAKSRDPRSVPVGPWVLAYYDRYTAERLSCPSADACDFVFVNLFHAPLGAPMTYSAVRQMVGGLGRRAGLARPATPHVLRHAAATEMVEAGVPIDVVQSLLGHRSIVTTQRYTHTSQPRMRDAVDAVEAVTRRRRAEHQNAKRDKR
jgi:site-specific recombinase XerD